LPANVYEALFILDSNRYSRDPAAVANQISEMITQSGGEVLANRLWEERRLAYPINGQRKGTYWLTYFRVGTDKLTGINRQCQLNENIVRFLFVRVDPRIVDALVSHALTSGGPVVERRGPAAPEAVVVVPEEVAVEIEEV
jgi:small subunit ribosomal protein S6